MNLISLTETLVDAQGQPYAGQTVVIESLGTPLADDGMGLVGTTRVSAATDSGGELSLSLLTGQYVLRWQIGTARSEWRFTVPYTGGPYMIRHLGSGDRESLMAQGWRFAGIGGAILQLRNASTGDWHSIIVAKSEIGELSLGTVAAGDASDGPNWKEASDTFYLYSPVGGTWHAPVILGSASTPELGFLGSGIAASGNHRIKNGRRQILNTETNLFHSLFITGAIGDETYAIGPGET